MASLVRLRFSLAALLAVTACSGGSDDDGDGPDPGVAITSFTATPSTVAGGETTTLAWVTTKATRIVVAAEPGGQLVDTTEASGSATSSALTETTTFTLTAEGPGGPKTQSVTVTVQGGDPTPAVTRFAATPATIAPGAMSTLSWETTDADSVTITAGASTVVDAGPVTGSQIVMPADTTIYTLVATGPGGTAMAMVTVQVVSTPVVNSFTAAPNPIEAGESTTLSWNVDNADQITITDSAGSSEYDGTDLTGSVSVTPATTETYTLTARNANGMDTESVMVTVNQPGGPTIASFTAAPSTVDLGDPVTLSWSVTNANTITIDDGSGTATTTTDLTGSWVVTPAADTTYVLTASDGTNPDATASVSVTVTIVAVVPTIVDFSAAPNPVALTATTALSYEVVNATTVRILQGGTTIFTSTASTATATVAITAPSTTFTLEASNADGTNTATLLVHGHGAPVINTLSVAPATIAVPTTVTVTWDVSSTNVLELYVNGALDTTFAGVVAGMAAIDATGAHPVLVSGATTFRLVATSEAGTVEQTASVAALPMEIEPNDVVGSATALPSGGGTLGGAISANADVDWYAITVSAGDSIRAETTDGATGCAMDTILTLTSTDGVTELAFDDDGGIPYPPGGACSLIDPLAGAGSTDLAAGTYFLAVESYDNASTGPYVLTVDVIPAACGNGILNRASETCDDGNTTPGDGCDGQCQFEPAGAFVASPGNSQTLTGLSIPLGQVDIFVITVPAGPDVYLIAETFTDALAGVCNGIDTEIWLYDASLTEIATDDQDGVGDCSLIEPTSDTGARLTPGTYSLHVGDWLFDDAIPAYELVLSAVQADICGNGVVDAAEHCDDGNTVGGDTCPATCTFAAIATGASTPALVIPDDDPTGATDTITISATPACAIAGVIGIDVDITHAYRGDVEITLTSPMGTSVILKASDAFDGAPNIVGSFPTTLTPANPLTPFIGQPANGAWTLFMQDVFAPDAGLLNAWSVRFGCQ